MPGVTGGVTAKRRCENCQKSLRGKRADARTCSPACRQALYRVHTENAVPAELLAMWRELRAEYGGDVTVGRIKRAAVNRLKRMGRDHQAAARREKQREQEPLIACDGCGHRQPSRNGSHDGWIYRGHSRGLGGDCFYEVTLCAGCYRASGLAAEDARRYAADLEAGIGYCDYGHGRTEGRYEDGGWSCRRCYEDWAQSQAAA